MSTKRISILARVDENGHSSDINVEGYAYLNSGFLSGLISSGSKTNQVLLSAFTFTGCPLAANLRTKNEDVNPWVWTDGEYSATRTLESGEFKAVSKIICVSKQGELKAKIMLCVVGSVPELTGVAAPFQETMTQAGTGLLLGEFHLQFLGRNGNIEAHCRTDYKLNTKRAMVPMYRNITINDSDEGSATTRQIEQIDLFDDMTLASQDLLARISTHH